MRARRRNKNEAKDEILNYDSTVFIDNSTYQENKRPEIKEKIDSITQNAHNTIIEVGMGDGTFLIEYAKRHPETTCFGVELKEERIVNGAKMALDNNLSNVYIIKTSAEYLDELFNKNSIDCLFINFPDPWPKKRHIKNRLVNERFLTAYHKIIKENKEIHLKTDNPIVYEYALETLPENGFTITKKTDNHPDSEDNIKTKYENRYRSFGKNIHKIIAKK